uniref:Uncharacterized protein n=1 Tax=Siphoviridae sp. ct45W1 TaxID=2823562 RepID=A0A8S5L6V8_9CAUD|nr:MAG TPA: hypothetical protein [Siphoviridae sp. ct45W1]
MAKITLHIAPTDAAELAAITAALAPFVSAGAPAAEQPATAAEEAPKPKPRASRKAKPAEEPKAEEPAVPPTEPASSTEQTSGGELGSREALLDAMRSALKAGKRAEVAQVLREFGAARATELKDEDVVAATAMVAAL